MILELRQYWCKPGKRAEWVRYMEETLIPHQVALGVVVVGSFIDTDDPDHYVWIRRFESEPERERLYAALYGDPRWEGEMLPVVQRLLDRERTVVTQLEATSLSVIS